MARLCLPLCHQQRQNLRCNHAMTAQKPVGRVVVGAELWPEPASCVHSIHLAATSVAGPWRELVHLQVAEVTRRHVSSWPWSSFITYGLEPFDPVSRWLVHYRTAAILEVTCDISSNVIVLTLIVRRVIGAWWRCVVSFLRSEPLLAWRPVGTSRVWDGR